MKLMKKNNAVSLLENKEAKKKTLNASNYKSKSQQR